MHMSGKIIRLGVVGLKRGLTLLKAAAGENNVQIYAVCDTKPDRLEEAQNELKGIGVTDCLAFSSFDAMLQSDIDAVIIATEATVHAPYAIKALNAGKHVLSEIPAVDSIEEARELKHTLKSHPELKYMMGENCCYWAFVQAWKTMADEGRFGDFVYGEGEYLHTSDYRKYTPETHKDDRWRLHLPAIKYITHSLGPLLYIMNDRAESVTCFEPTAVYNPYKQAPGNGAALIRTKKGAVIRIFVAFGAYAGYNHSYRLTGTRGSIETERLKNPDEAHSYARFSDIHDSLYTPFEIPVTTRFNGESNGEDHGGSDRKMLKAFFDSIINDTQPELGIDFAINTSLSGVLAHESALKNGKPIKIPYRL